MKTIWVVQYNNGTADVFDEYQGPPSWPYVDAIEAEQRIAELEEDLTDALSDLIEFAPPATTSRRWAERLLKQLRGDA